MHAKPERKINATIVVLKTPSNRVINQFDLLRNARPKIWLWELEASAPLT